MKCPRCGRFMLATVVLSVMLRRNIPIWLCENSAHYPNFPEVWR